MWYLIGIINIMVKGYKWKITILFLITIWINMNTFKNILLKLFLIFAILSMLIASGIGGVYSNYKKMDE